MMTDIFFLAGRESEMIRACGCEIAAADFEAVILRNDLVRDCAVFGMPAGVTGDIVYVCIETTGAKPDVDALACAVRTEFALSDLAVQIEVLESLPREDSGKVLKHRLRERFNTECKARA